MAVAKQNTICRQNYLLLFLIKYQDSCPIQKIDCMGVGKEEVYVLSFPCCWIKHVGADTGSCSLCFFVHCWVPMMLQANPSS